MTGTELLMEVMDRFSEHGDAEDVLVVYSDVNGRVRLKTNCTSATRALGLAQYASAELQDIIVHGREET